MKRARALSIGVGIMIGLLLPMLTHAAVTSVNALQTALAAARPGDIIIVQNGTYADATFTLAASGTASAPITLKAQTPGQAVLSGVHIVIPGNYWILDGFDVVNGQGGAGCGGGGIIAVCGSNNIIRNSRFGASGFVGATIEILGGNYNTIVQSTFENITTWHIISLPNDASGNTIRDSRFLNFAGGGAIVATGGSDALDAPYTTFEHNYVANSLGHQFAEMLRLKSSHAIVRNNYFLNNTGGLIFQRIFDYGLIEGNVAINNKDGNVGIVAVGYQHTVRNNYIEGNIAVAGFFAGDYDGPSTVSGCTLGGPHHYQEASSRGTYDQNTMALWGVNGGFSLGWDYGTTRDDKCGQLTTFDHPPSDFVGRNNLFYSPGQTAIYVGAAPNDTWVNNVVQGTAGYSHSGITTNNSLTVTRDSHGLLTVGAPSGVGYQGSNVPFSPNEVGASWTGGMVVASPANPAKNLRIVE